ncbi:hypothetical protein H5410_041115 [Solanum commersonii]|uniref:Uncharacterized protein n=1 Tax=Solanum commersonii TaxID=4109 RepID=A0A9J5XQX1_SOLCO|nr:hypothetical protein H5410_041115 [Solanum commersonii]
MVQGELNTSNPSGPLTLRTYNKDRDHEIFAKMVIQSTPFLFDIGVEEAAAMPETTENSTPAAAEIPSAHAEISPTAESLPTA